MAMIINETAAKYHARKAVSASLLWNIVKPSGCLAKARYESKWLNPDYVQPPNHDLDFGTLAHLAVLEPDLLDSQVVIFDTDNWRGSAAKTVRDEAYAEGKVPILAERTSRTPKTVYTMTEVFAVRKALEESEAAELLFGAGGKSEVTYTWTDEALPCKARADRSVITLFDSTIVDLKTAESASWDAFQRAMERDGHYLRAAWYIDGWGQQPEQNADVTYRFVVVEKSPPYLSAIWECDDRAIEWGRRWIRRALALLRGAQESGEWTGYAARGVEKQRKVPLRGFREWDFADLEKAGLL